MRALAVIDGEHYGPVVRDALAALPYEIVAVWLAGGTEKLLGGEDYGAPLVADLEAGIAEHEPELVDRSLRRTGAGTARALPGREPRARTGAAVRRR